MRRYLPYGACGVPRWARPFLAAGAGTWLAFRDAGW
jgi:hypothetical protein